MALVAAQAATMPVSVVPDPPRYRVGGFWRRAAAATIDLMLLVPILGMFGAVLSLCLGRPLPHPGELGPDLLLSALLDGSSVGEAICLLGGIVVLLYFFVFHSVRGQTPGKRLLGLMVIDVYGERPGLARTLLRTCGYVLSAALFSLGFLWIGFDRERRALHDWLAGTYVVLAR